LLGFELLGRELRMIKEVPIGGPGFRAVLREIVASIVARKPSTATSSSRRPLPQRYAAESSAGVFRGIFGRKGL
jgi:hypothetical protein